MPLAVFLAAVLSLVGCTEARQKNLLQSGDELLTRSQPREAAELFRKAIALNPSSKSAVRGLYKLGFTQETYLSDFESAVFNYQEYIRLSSDRLGLYEVQKRLANILFEQQRDPEKSVAAYRKLLSIHPDSLEADQFQLRIAQSFFRANNFEQSRIEFQTLIDKFPKSQFVARARYEIGNSYFMEEKYDIALEALKQVQRLHAQSEYAVEATFLMAQCFEHTGEFGDALQSYESIRGRYPAQSVVDLRIGGVKKRIEKKQ